MTIGQALKEEQNRLGITGEEMVKGIISKSAYSRVINNKRNISSEALIKILFRNDIDIDNFFSKLEDTYSPDSKRLEKKLSLEMAEAVNNHKKEEMMKCYKKFLNADISIFIKKRAKLTNVIKLRH